MKLQKILTIIFSSTLLSIAAYAQEIEYGDLHLNNYETIAKKDQNLSPLRPENEPYTLLDFADYQMTVSESRLTIQSLINFLNKNSYLDLNQRLSLLAKQFIGIPFIYSGALGEGDWQPDSSLYQPGASHVKQDPVYRSDGYNCQTLVQMVMALLYSSTLDEFDRNILKINYGAAGNPSGEIVHYYNRNNFIDGDWNPINQYNGFLEDVTSQQDFRTLYDVVYANITRQNWFDLQAYNLRGTVRVINNDIGFEMAERYSTLYLQLNFEFFDSETIAMPYIPKLALVSKQTNGKYLPNTSLINKIPTPSIIEIVRDPKLWTIGDKNIKEAIGSELSISHMGILYKKTVHQGDVIYQKINCHYDSKGIKKCTVTPVKCSKSTCNELMFLHASNAWPNGYYWYSDSKNHYACTATLPKGVTNYTSCNRVQEQPLGDYLSDYQYGSYRFLDTPSILGIHIEKLR